MTIRILTTNRIKWGYSTCKSDKTLISLYSLPSDMKCQVKEGRRLARQALQWTFNDMSSKFEKKKSLCHHSWSSTFRSLIASEMTLNIAALFCISPLTCGICSHSEIFIRMSLTCPLILESSCNLFKILFASAFFGFLSGTQCFKAVSANWKLFFFATALDTCSSRNRQMSLWEGMSLLLPESLFGRYWPEKRSCHGSSVWSVAGARRMSTETVWQCIFCR